MKVTIARAHENLFSGEAESLTLPLSEGVATILPHHEPFVSTLSAGKVTVRSAEGEKVFDVESGVLEVSNNQATVIL
ncbi:hypothetical protein COU15_00460 [Candidatus Kaiserbacteria bacterium CG10_big_fil_rev_8_21_14_0_10_45_20]|uniref:ATP synthase F1 complex delta/epsilon subunit N-terminal domain-containing protein n=1 Tax=Candidatus Kaiserbacteria bacterium CG10_big_fil_rev_8_21_14_0_10_45_20 TaxID=1974607 RepID=A0A2H0UGK9_9BACT|nr:MAG: hypothetical protein COU15_00460 [Candidatus Kaiserbacteria bacterium CG10_big_fil_rev_8_21_14_0_10_45_20]